MAPLPPRAAVGAGAFMLGRSYAEVAGRAGAPGCVKMSVYSCYVLQSNQFLIIGNLTLCIMLVWQSTNLRSQPNISTVKQFGVLSMNSSVYEHVHCCQTTKFRAHEINDFTLAA